MGSVSEIKSDNESFVMFRWNYTKASSQQTTLFNFGNLGKECFVKMDYSSGSSYIFNIQFSIHFTVKPSFEEIETFNLTAYFNNSKNGITFTLNKISDQIFMSQDLSVYSYDLYNQSVFDIDIKISMKKNNDVDELVTDMKQLLSSTIYSDLKLIVDDKTFNVHKNILSTRNHVFSKMIQADMLEKNTSTIKLSQWDPLVVDQLLRYIYTGTCNVTLNPHELFKLSHYLEVKPLQDLCNAYMQSTINIKNVIDTLELAKQSQYGLSSLKDAAEKFVASNESTLAKDFDYTEYLSNTIDNDNVESILKFSSQYEIESLLQKAIDYATSNHKEVFKIEKFKQLLLSTPQLMFKICIFALDAKEALEQKEVKE